MKKILMSLAGLSMTFTAFQAIANHNNESNNENEYAGVRYLFARADQSIGFMETPGVTTPIEPQEVGDNDLSHFSSLYIDHCGHVYGCVPEQPQIYLKSIPWEAFQNPEILNLIGSALGHTTQIGYIN